jgi:hypothetical protein
MTSASVLAFPAKQVEALEVAEAKIRPAGGLV